MYVEFSPLSIILNDFLEGKWFRVQDLVQQEAAESALIRPRPSLNIFQPVS